MFFFSKQKFWSRQGWSRGAPTILENHKEFVPFLLGNESGWVFRGFKLMEMNEPQRLEGFQVVVFTS